MGTGGRQDIAIDTCISTAVTTNVLSKLCLCIPKLYEESKWAGLVLINETLLLIFLKLEFSLILP